MSPYPSSSPRLHLGAAYYPEHWPEERWTEDIRLMREAGFTVVRMAEFAWSTLEPAEGEFHFDWLERAIALLAEANISTVLGTPTAAPPAWLVDKHPEILAVDENGRPVQFGNRCHYCVNSETFHAATRRIVSAMAARFGQNPHVIGWQLDNEYNRVCYCERCRALFQRYLADRFGSLEALNRHWTTRYWSQTYSAWEQIPLPVGYHNPGLLLEFKRFVTESYRRFQRLQLDVLRPCLRPGVWVTHNFMGWFDGFDHYALSADLDLASWDWYVGTGHHDPLASGAAHDLTRGFKRRNFWLIETQPGCVNWAPINTMLDRGEGRAMAWHAVAHGADAVLYWQWRPAANGQEQYHGSLLDSSGQPRPFYDEVRQLGKEFPLVSELLYGASTPAQVAILNDYESRWSIQWQRHHHGFDYVAHLNHYYRPLAARNVPADIVPADAPLDGYRLVIAPALILLGEARAARLHDFVARGGHLVLTARCGMKDEYNALLPLRQPGFLRDCAGVEVEEYYALAEPVPVEGDGISGRATIWAERLRALDGSTRVLARYGVSNGWLDGQAAITEHPFGLGRVHYVGAWLDAATQEALLERILAAAGVEPVLVTPEGVEARLRVNGAGQETFLLINHRPSPATVQLPWPAYDHLRGAFVGDTLPLAGYEVSVLTRVSG